MKRRNLLALAAGTPLISCAASVDVANWVEEVKLHDGRLIDVARRASRQHSGFPSYWRGPVIDYGLSYQQTRWSGPWSRIPASFEIFDGIPHLTTFIGDLACNTKPVDAYGALFFRLENGAWTEVPQKEFPTSFALVNLVEDFWGHTDEDDPKGRLSWQEKAGKGGFRSEPAYTVDTYFSKFKNMTCRWLQR